jgi:hypothetical protein
MYITLLHQIGLLGRFFSSFGRKGETGFLTTGVERESALGSKSSECEVLLVDELRSYGLGGRCSWDCGELCESSEKVHTVDA